MIPGEMQIQDGDIEFNVGRPTRSIEVGNTGDRPVQVGSHYHFYETNPALTFDRQQTRGWRLNIAAGTAVRFEPGQTRTVELVPIGGGHNIYGFRGEVMGHVDMLAVPNDVRNVENVKKEQGSADEGLAKGGQS